VGVSYTRDRLGQLLVRSGVITEDQLFDALAYQEIHGGKIGQILAKNLVVDEDVIARTLAEQKGLEFLSLTMFPVDREAAALIPERVARRSQAIPIGFRDGALVLAMADPLDVEAIDDVHLRTRLNVLPVVATAAQIDYAIEKFITSADAVEGLAASVAEEVEEQVEAIGDDDVPIVRLVNQLMREAVMDGASDIHIEPGANEVRVRFRVDGVLNKVMTAPVTARAGLISRVKVMADMDIAERRRPQDGRISIVVNDRLVDMRVATLPTPFGENLVLRILNHEATQASLNDLGMSEEHRATFERFLKRSWGEILVSGPTGSGKSTTLYAGLTHINDPAVKIITIEDPIEYQIPGVTQMAVNPGIGLSFAQLLRTVLRSDPDVVLVGEIRDAETAQIATRAALTGHLVLSSIHTNDAPSALTRLTDMEVAPFVASSALIGVVAQRLVRRLCPVCRQEEKLSKTMLTDRGFGFDELRVRSVFSPKPGGCDECHGTGYRGRVGVFEIMPMDAELERLFLSSAPSEAIRDAALAAGMKTLRTDGLEKVGLGMTSLDEVARVVL
jgi:type IV pilus assembly protein PilB